MMDFTITELHSGLRLDVVLSEHTHLGSRSRVSKLIKEKKILSADKPVKPSHRCEVGDVFQIPAPGDLETKDVGLKPFEIELDILFENEDVIVVNKPAGLVMHPAPGHEQDTLVNALIHHCKDLSMGTGEKRPGIVHRLDKDTSGVLGIAKNNATHEYIAKQFKERTTHRVYYAVVYGHPTFSEKTVESHFIRHPKDRKKYVSEKYHEGAEPKGKKAITHIEVINKLPSGLSVIKCQLETGRTHQIRIHCSDLGHAIVGDQVYGNSSRANSLDSVKLRKDIQAMKRVALHAAELGFELPNSERLDFNKEWPSELFFLWSGIL